jgi:DNA-binding transcriptional LysR family regulator
VVQVNGNFSAENGVPLYKVAQAGLGVAIQPEFVLDGFRDKNIVRLLQDYQQPDIGIYAIYPNTRKLPLNTRVFIDYLAERFGATK